MASDPENGFRVDGGVVRPAGELPADPLIFTELQQATCATSGVAHVLHYPRHLRRE